MKNADSLNHIIELQKPDYEINGNNCFITTTSVLFTLGYIK